MSVFHLFQTGKREKVTEENASNPNTKIQEIPKLRTPKSQQIAKPRRKSKSQIPSPKTTPSLKPNTIGALAMFVALEGKGSLQVEPIGVAGTANARKRALNVIPNKEMTVTGAQRDPGHRRIVGFEVQLRPNETVELRV